MFRQCLDDEKDFITLIIWLAENGDQDKERQVHAVFAFVRQLLQWNCLVHLCSIP